MIDVGLVTCSRLPQLDEDNQLLLHALQKRGIKAHSVIWDDPAQDWANIKLCILRSTWDYQESPSEFLNWVDQVSTQTALWNPAACIHWNINKVYLKELENKGIHIVRTKWIRPADEASLDKVLCLAGWQEGVIKPTISASAENTYRVSMASPKDGQAHLTRLLDSSDVMLQPYLTSIETRGEYSAVFINGAFQHAVRKVPAKEDFRVQENLGGTTESIELSGLEVDFARNVMKALSFETLYSRVDMVYNNFGELCLTELELIEPSLYLKHAPETVDAFANTIQALLN